MTGAAIILNPAPAHTHNCTHTTHKTNRQLPHCPPPLCVAPHTRSGHPAVRDVVRAARKPPRNLRPPPPQHTHTRRKSPLPPLDGRPPPPTPPTPLTHTQAPATWLCGTWCGAWWWSGCTATGPGCPAWRSKEGDRASRPDPVRKEGRAGAWWAGRGGGRAAAAYCGLFCDLPCLVRPIAPCPDGGPPACPGSSFAALPCPAGPSSTASMAPHPPFCNAQTFIPQPQNPEAFRTPPRAPCIVLQLTHR